MAERMTTVALSKPKTFVLPFPPSVNDYWHSRAIKVNGKWMPTVYVSKDGKDFRKAVSEKVFEQSGFRNPVTLFGRVAVEVTLFAKDLRARDLDNFLKSLLDALTAATVWGDDKQIDLLLVKRGPIARTNPRVEIKVSIIKTQELFPE